MGLKPFKFIVHVIMSRNDSLSWYVATYYNCSWMLLRNQQHMRKAVQNSNHDKVSFANYIR
jgi:hypothetical protein